MSPSRLRASDLVAPTSGVRVHTAAQYEERCRAVLLALSPHAFLCGGAAAELHGIPLPWRLGRPPQVEVATPGPGRAVRRAGIVARSLVVFGDEVRLLRGIRLTSPARTWCDLARTLTVPELVAAGDPLLVRGADLVDAARRHPDRRLHAKLRTALDLLDTGSESPKESETRAVLQLGGLPRPRSNVPIFDGGRFLARVDLLYEEYGEVLEYQGDHHRTEVGQWRRDRGRIVRLEDTGLHVIEVTQLDLDDPAAFVARVARTLARKGWAGAPQFSRWFPT